MAVLAVEVVLFSASDRRRFKSWFTPFTILAVPYTLIVIIAGVFSKSLGFVALEAGAVAIWVAGLFLFWGGGRLVTYIIKEPKKVVDREKQNRQITSFVLVPSLVVVVVMIVNFRNVSEGLGGLQIATASDIFTNIHYGVLSLSKIVAMVYLIILVGTTTRKKILTNIMILLLIAALTLYQVKGDLLIPLIGGLILRFRNFGLKINIYLLILIIISVYIIFNIFYLFSFSVDKGAYVWHDLDTYKYIFRHFFAYLFSGPLTLSNFIIEGEFSQAGRSSLPIFASIINLFRHVNGTYDLAQPIRVLEYANVYSVIDLVGLKDSNVHTLFGTVIYYLGWAYGLIYSVLLGVASYFLYLYSKTNIWLATIYSLIAGALFFGWFEYYFWHSFFILAIITISILFVINVFVDMLKSKRTR